jgi:ribosome biogenesis protein Nip4
MRQLEGFLRSIGAGYEVPEEDVVRINNKRFAASPALRASMTRRDRLIYAGRFLGRTKNVWEPSAILLREVAGQSAARKAWVDDQAAWLFVCGRDVFTERITRIDPEAAEGTNYLVMLGDDCLGYGRLQTVDGKLILRNLFDIGDFLRREKWREE